MIIHDHPSSKRWGENFQHRMGQRLPRPAAAQAELRRPVEAQPGGRRHGEEAAPAGGMEVAWALKKTMEIHGKRK